MDYGKFIISAGNNLYKDMSYLDTSVNTEILERDNELKHFGMLFGNFLNGSSVSNKLITGPPGTGKTMMTVNLIQNAQRKLQQSVDTSKLINYVNCIDYSSLKKLMTNLTGKGNMSNMSDYFGEFYKMIDSKYSNYLLVLDEFNNDLLVDKFVNNFFYYLTRPYEGGTPNALSNCKFSVIIITNLTKELLDEKLQPNTISSLSKNIYRVERYNESQIYNILKFRCDRAFVEETLDSELLKYISKHIADRDGDIRQALDLLRLSADISVNKDKKCITLAEFTEALNKYEMNHIQNALFKATKHEKTCFFVLSLVTPDIMNRLSTSLLLNLYQVFCNEFIHDTPIQRRQLQNIINFLDNELGLVQSEMIRGSKYITTNLNVNNKKYFYKIFLNMFNVDVDLVKDRFMQLLRCYL